MTAPPPMCRASVLAVFRRPRSLALLVVAAGLAVSGCTTFTDDDAVARVGDVELSEDELDDIAFAIRAQAAPADEADDPDLTIAELRQATSLWVQARLQDDFLDGEEIDVDDASRDEAVSLLTLSPQLPRFGEATQDTQDLLVEFVAGGQVLSEQTFAAPPELVEAYADGPLASGVLCVSHVLVADADAAEPVIDELEAGTEFALVAAEFSDDPGSAAQGGDLGCWFTDEFRTTFVPEFVDGALDAEVGEPTEPVISDFGAHVILIRPADESLDGLAALVASPGFLVRGADIHVDPRIGSYDSASNAVLPLG